MVLSRACPDCGTIQIYNNKYALAKAINQNRRCRSCCKKGKRNAMYGKGYLQIGIKNPNYGNPNNYRHSEETKTTISNKKLGIKRPELAGKNNPAKRSSVRRKISEKMTGKGNHRYGKKPWNYGKTGYSTSLRGRIPSKETREKMRIARINYMNKLNGSFYPNYNLNACSIFEVLNKNGFNGVHAECDGEYYVKTLGYWLDFYDEERKLAIEYYEAFHYKAGGILKQKEIERENKIIKELGCDFMRINAFNEQNLKFEVVRNDRNYDDLISLNVEATK